MKRRNRRRFDETSNLSVKRTLENRIVFCPDCDANRTLSVSTCGNLTCSSCGSENWMHVPVTANIKESVFIKGELTVDENLTIEGRVEGKISVKNHSLWISSSGKINAEIHAKNVIVAGELVGNIYASEMVAIKSKGFVVGDIKSSRISIADGARFKGSIDTEGSAEAAETLDLPKAESAKLRHNQSSGKRGLAAIPK